MLSEDFTTYFMTTGNPSLPFWKQWESQSNSFKRLGTGPNVWGRHSLVSVVLSLCWVTSFLFKLTQNFEDGVLHWLLKSIRFDLDWPLGKQVWVQVIYLDCLVAALWIQSALSHLRSCFWPSELFLFQKTVRLEWILICRKEGTPAFSKYLLIVKDFLWLQEKRTYY